MATTYLIRKTGNDNNGGTSASVRSTGTDGVTSGTNTLTSATGTWSAADIGHGVFIGGVNQWRLITAVASATSLTFSGATIATATGRTWTIGGSWLTIGKALGTTGMASGDTVYVGSGVYRENVSATMTSATSETKVLGDVDGAQTGDTGEVRLTSFLTNDKTAASGVTLEFNGRDFLTFENLFIIGVGGAVSSNASGAATNITFRKCYIFDGTQNGQIISIGTTGSPADTALNWLIDSCIIVGAGIGFSITAASSTTATYDLGIVIKNTLFLSFGSNGVRLTKGGANTFLGGGIKVQNCTIFSSAAQVTTVTGGSTTYPINVYNCVLLGAGSAVAAANTGEIVEDYNVISNQTARTNVTAGGNSVTGYAPLVNIGQSYLWGFLPKFPFSPTIDSPLLGFGSDASVSFTADMLGRDRPSGAGVTWASALKGVGALEYHDFARKEATVTDSGDGWKLTGPGDHDILIPVDASSTTLAIKTRYDTNHGTGSKPQAELIANASIGVTGEVKTATVGVDTWETLTFSAITPTAKGWVIVRLRSRSAAGNGLCYFDTLTGV